MKQKKGFTLIELLVVIAIIALLLSILMPSLQKVKEQARKVICKSNLHQWGIVFEMYVNEHNGKFMPGIDDDFQTARYSWVVTLKSYHETPAIRLCPVAKRPATENDMGPTTAWDMTPAINAGQLLMLKDTEYKTGSYGINWWTNSGKTTAAGYDHQNKWGKIEKGAADVPVLMDCGFFLARPLADNQPPTEDGQYAFAVAGGAEMRRVCTNRHNFNVNILYMDWSSNEVGLKDLWYQEWHRNYEPPMVEPAWPEWMNSAKPRSR